MRDIPEMGAIQDPHSARPRRDIVSRGTAQDFGRNAASGTCLPGWMQRRREERREEAFQHWMWATRFERAAYRRKSAPLIAKMEKELLAE